MKKALIEMHLAGVSVRRVDDIIEVLWGSKVSLSTISEPNQKNYVHIEGWRNRPFQRSIRTVTARFWVLRKARELMSRVIWFFPALVERP